MASTLKNRLVYHIHDNQLKLFSSKYLKGKLIDIGCGTKPYEELLSPFVAEHIGLDFEGSIHDQSKIDIFGSAYKIPVNSNSFDCAICTAVLEHLEEPESALKECFRILKKGGYAIYSIPFIWHLHEEPRDFFRYSKYAIEYLFKKTGFEVIEIKALSGFWVTIGQLFVYYVYRFNKGPFKWLRIIDVFGLAIQSMVYILDRIDKAERWTWMYMVVVKK